MTNEERMDTKYGPLVVWATSRDHIGARLPDDATATLHGVEYRAARVDLHRVAEGIAIGRPGFVLPGYDNQPAAYRDSSDTWGTTFHGYGVMMHRADYKDTTEAAAHAFRAEVIERLAEFAATDQGLTLLHQAEVESKQHAYDRAAEKYQEADTALQAAFVALQAAVDADV